MRILLTFLLDVNARPNPNDMKLWVDVLRFIKRGARGGALGFFTYAELSKSHSELLHLVAGKVAHVASSILAALVPSVPAKPSQVDVVHHAGVGRYSSKFWKVQD